MNKLSIPALALSLCFLVLTGCESQCEWEGEGDPEIASFTSSADTVLPGGELDLEVIAVFFELRGGSHSHDDEEGEEGGHEHDDGPGPCPGGHYHDYLDDLMTNPLAMPTTSEVTVTIPEDTEPGEHTLLARLHDDEHLIVEPQVIAELVIEVEEFPVPGR